MAERGGGVYKRLDARAYTRKSEKVPRKGYIKGVPHPKIHQFEGGNSKGNFDIELSLVSNETAQLKHNSMEAARVAATKTISTVGPNEFFLKVRVYPHHVLRLNPLATGAGADRFSQGMSQAFGKVIGTAARVKKGQKIMSIRVKEDKLLVAKDALRRAKMKFPITSRILVEELKEKPEKEVKEEKPAEKGEAKEQKNV